MFFRQVPLVTTPQAILGQQQTIDAQLQALQEKFVAEQKQTMLHVAIISGAIGLVLGVVITPIAKDLLGMKK